jgi:broad specificity phosphatase PhoE
MRLLIVARHGESVASARDVVNSDPQLDCPLTDAGRGQARRLGELLAAELLDLCVTTPFPRTAETADLALAGRDVPRLVVPELADPRAGIFEGRPLAEYRAWAHAHGPDEAPPGGESHEAALRRFCAGYARLLELEAETVLQIGHSFPISVALVLSQGEPPAGAIYPGVPYATAFRLDAEAVERVVAALSSSEAASERRSA